MIPNELKIHYSKFGHLKKLLKKSTENCQVVTHKEIRKKKTNILSSENHKKILTAEEEVILYEKNSKEINAAFGMKDASQDYDKRSATVPYTELDYNRMKNENPESLLPEFAP